MTQWTKVDDLNLIPHESTWWKKRTDSCSCPEKLDVTHGDLHPQMCVCVCATLLKCQTSQELKACLQIKYTVNQLGEQLYYFCEDSHMKKILLLTDLKCLLS